MKTFFRINSLLSLFVQIFQQIKSDTLPLSFEIDTLNPLKTRIYLNPMVNIQKIQQLSTREVEFYENNKTHTLDVEFADWTPLLQNVENPSQKFALIKTEMCNEKDFKISWLDESGKLHGEVLQHLGPSPQVWNDQNVKIRILSIRRNEKFVFIDLEYPSFDKITKQHDSSAQKEYFGAENLAPIVVLEKCEILFEKPIDLPILEQNNRTVKISKEYADNFCIFSIHLSMIVYDRDDECRQLLQTNGESSARIALR